MSYVPILKSLPETFHSSTNLAVLASLGVHGLLWVILPAIPSSSRSVGPSQQTVGLVQLTPDELSRLPQASIPPVELPAFATQPSTLPPLPPPPDLRLLQQIPGGTTNYKDLLNIPFQPQLQTLAPLSVPYQNNSVPSKPDNQNNFIPFKFNNQLPPPPPPLSLVQPPDNQLPSPSPSSLRKPSNNQLPYVPVKPAPMPDFLTSLPTPAPTTSAEASNTAAANPLVAIPSTGSKIPQRTIDELLARREQLREPSSQETSNGSTLVALTEDLRKWFIDVNPTSSSTRRISPTYPQQACPRQLEGTASIVALVDPKGNIINGPKLNKTTGYNILDQAAVAAVKGYEFKSRSDERQAYLFGVEFKYSRANCADTPQPTPENRNSASPQPTPENRNSTSPQPTPENRNSASPQPTPENRNSTSPQPTPENRNSASPQPTPENRNSTSPQPTPENRNSLRSILEERNSATPQPTLEEGSATPQPTPETESEQPKS